MQERFVAGSLAGATAQTIIYPMEVRAEATGRGTAPASPPVPASCPCYSRDLSGVWGGNWGCCAAVGVVLGKKHPSPIPKSPYLLTFQPPS